MLKINKIFNNSIADQNDILYCLCTLDRTVTETYVNPVIQVCLHVVESIETILQTVTSCFIRKRKLVIEDWKSHRFNNKTEF